VAGRFFQQVFAASSRCRSLTCRLHASTLACADVTGRGGEQTANHSRMIESAQSRDQVPGSSRLPPRASICARSCSTRC
jgi:hypothetical protein